MAISHIKSNIIPDFTGTVTVFDSQGATVSMNATDLVRPVDWNSAHNQFLTISGNTAGVSTVSGTNIVFAGGNNVTLSANGSTISINGPSTVAQTQFVLSNANGISFGTNGSTVTATVATNYQSQGAYLTTARASNDALGLNTALTANGLSVTANSSGLSINVPPWITTYVGQTTQTQPAGNIAGAGYTSTTQAGSTLGVTHNSNGLSLAQPPFITTYVAQTTQTQPAGNIAGIGTSATNASITLNSNGLAISVAAPGGGGGGIAASIGGGNSTSAGAGYSNITSGTMLLFGGNNITLSQNGAAITISGGAAGAADGINALVVNGGASTVSTTLSLSNGNNVSFGLAAGVITASASFLQSTQQALGTNTALTANGVSMTANTAGLSLNFPVFLTTAQSPGAYLTTARASNDAIGLNTALTANGLSVTANSSGLSINVPPWITTYVNDLTSGRAGTGYTSTTQGGSTVGVTQNTAGLSAAWPPFLTTYAGQTTQTQPAGNIAGIGTSATNASITLNSNGLAISVAAGGGGADGYNIIQGSGNTAGTMNTYASATFVLAGGNNITLSQSSNTMSIIGVASQTNQTAASGNIAGIGTSATNASITLNSNGLAISVAAPGGGAGFTGGVSTGGNTLGTTGTVNQQLVFVGGNNITLSQSSAAGGSATITIVGPAAGGGAGATINDYEIYPLANNTSFSSFSQNALHFQRIMPMNNVSMTAIEMLISMSSVTSSISHSVGHTMSYGIYTKGTGASTSQMQSMATSSFYIQASYSSNASGGYTVGQGTNSFTSSSAGTVFGSVLSGQKIMSLPFSTSLAAGGDYYLCFAQSSASVGNTGAIRMSHVVQTIATNGSWGQLDIGGARISNSSYSNEPYMVSYSATSGAWAATLAKSDMRLNANSINQMYALLEA